MNRRAVILVAIIGLIVADVVTRNRYGRVVDVHLDVLESLVEKTAAAVESGGRLTPNDLTEINYPLERARGLLGEYGARSDRLSFQRMEAVVDAYAGFAAAIDAARGDELRWRTFRPTLNEIVDDLRGRIAEARRALASEEGRS